MLITARTRKPVVSVATALFQSRTAAADGRRGASRPARNAGSAPKSSGGANRNTRNGELCP